MVPKNIKLKSACKNECNKIVKLIEASGLDKSSLKELESIQLLLKRRKKHGNRVKLFGVFVVITALLLLYLIHTPQVFARLWFAWNRVKNLERSVCVIRMSSSMQNAFMPRFDCDVCKHLDNVTKLARLTPEQFADRYAYSGVPVVITDATSNWTATRTFSWQFFKDLYSKESPALLNYENDCQFFRYQTEFESLGQFFQMSSERAELKDNSKPWYVGWSNCDAAVASVLRQHYQRPYFLPPDSETTRMDWIFMGSPGYGAHMHIDHVQNPSWQAQIRGKKRWILEPPPECFTSCHTLSVVVEPGEIIVIDTNQWYHQTLIVGEEISITIGSEFD